MAVARRNTQAGNPRKGRAYRVVKVKGGTRHVYPGGPSLFVPAKTPSARKGVAPKPKAPAKPNYLYSPMQILAGQTLKKAASDVTSAELNPQISALQQQQKSGTAQDLALMSRAGDYYKQLAERELNGVAAQRALSDNLVNQTRQVGGETYAAYTDLMNQVRGAQANDAAVRGTGLAGNAGEQLAQQLAQNQRIAGAEQAQGERSAAAQGAGWAQFANAVGQTQNLRGQEIQQQLTNRTLNDASKLDAQIAALQATRGQKTTDNLLKLRQQQFENQVVRTQLGQTDVKNQLDAASIQERASSAAAARREAARQKSLDRQNQQRLLNKRLQSDAQYHTAQLRVKAGRDPFTNKPLPKGTDPNKALAQWRLNYAQKHGYLPQTGPTKPGAKNKNGLTPTQVAAENRRQSKNVGTVQNLLGLMGSARMPVLDKNGKPIPGRTRPASQQETVGTLRSKGQPEWAIQAALSIRHHGFIIPSVQSQMRAAGVTVPKQWRRKPAGRKPPLANYSGFVGLPSIVGHA